MKAEQVDALGAPMPWEADPELQEMTPTELKSILGDDLTPREKAKLNEMCVQELEKELKATISAETSHIWQISSPTKDLAKNRIKLNHLLQEQKPLAPKVSPIIAPNHQDKAKVETKPTRGIKRRSIIDKENEGKLMR